MQLVFELHRDKITGEGNTLNFETQEQTKSVMFMNYNPFVNIITE